MHGDIGVVHTTNWFCYDELNSLSQCFKCTSKISDCNALRFLSSWELIEGDQEGKEEGRKKGRKEEEKRGMENHEDWKSEISGGVRCIVYIS